MPDITTHANVTMLIVFGVTLSQIIGFLFDVEGDVLFAVFVGCWIGVFAMKAVPFTTKRELIIRFYMTLILVGVCTFAAAYIVPIFVHLLPGLAQKTIGAVSGFIVTFFNQKLLVLTSSALDRWFLKVGA